MTDIFNIDLEAEGFRKNSLDWRKFRDNYNRLSATKIERGIKPLPLSLLLKLFGPQKVLTTYVVSRNASNELDYQPTGRVNDLYHSIADMKARNDTDKTVAKPLDFPGNGVFHKSTEDNKYVYKKPSTKTSKQGALPSRPVFQRSVRVPGRYFPKPMEDFSTPRTAFTHTENGHERPQTQPIGTVTYSAQSNAQSSRASHYSTRSDAAFVNRNARVHRGPVCKATDTLSLYSSRAASLSGKSSSTVKSMPNFSSNEFNQSKRSSSDGYEGKQEALSMNFRNDERMTSAQNGNYDTHSEIGHNDYYIIKRLRLSARHVSFPKRSGHFSTILQGRPKTLHRRDETDSSSETRMQPRARTHVGFAESELT